MDDVLRSLYADTQHTFTHMQKTIKDEHMICMEICHMTGHQEEKSDCSGLYFE